MRLDNFLNLCNERMEVRIVTFDINFKEEALYKGEAKNTPYTLANYFYLDTEGGSSCLYLHDIPEDTDVLTVVVKREEKDE